MPDLLSGNVFRSISDDYASGVGLYVESCDHNVTEDERGRGKYDGLKHMRSI